MQNIGLIGTGIVGNAFLQGMHGYNIYTYDKHKGCTCQNIGELALIAKIIFICLPTPMNDDGSCDISLIENAVQEIDNAKRYQNLPLIAKCEKWVECDTNIVVIKSTVPPGTTDYLQQKYPNIEFLFNPEFLTENNPVKDFQNQDRIIIGGRNDTRKLISDLYSTNYPNVPVVECSAVTAELSKYLVNCFLATKVSFANEIYQIAQKLGVMYEELINIATLDKRLGDSHWRVPGPMLVKENGESKADYGFGGKCFPKDLNALIASAIKLGIDPKVMQAAWNKNLEVRQNKDWNHIPWAVNKSSYGIEININDKETT
jgi:UDPglucose 6-dehydrogenase